jgi:putative ABC transport system substrate-binding protein
LPEAFIVVAGGTRQTQAAKNATKTIPLVMVGLGSDPVEAGLIESLALPGGNVTGVTNLTRELGGSGWSCSKKPFPNLPVSRFYSIRPIRSMYSR